MESGATAAAAASTKEQRTTLIQFPGGNDGRFTFGETVLKLHLDTFSSEEPDVPLAYERFERRMRYLAKATGTQYPLLANLVRSHLSGKALMRFETILAGQVDMLANQEAFFILLKQLFISPEEEQRAREQLLVAVQGEHESVQDFHWRLQQLSRRSRMSPSEAKTYFFQGLRSPALRNLERSSGQCSYDEAVNVVSMAEWNQLRRKHVGSRLRCGRCLRSGHREAICPNGQEPPPAEGGACSASTKTTCAVCLNAVRNKARVDPCLHEFCYHCLLTWSREKPECPLCKAVFTQFFHHIKSDHNYQVYVVPQPLEDESHFSEGSLDDDDWDVDDDLDYADYVRGYSDSDSESDLVFLHYPMWLTR